MTCPTHPGRRDFDELCADCHTVKEIRAERACRNDPATLAWVRGMRKSSDSDRKRLGVWLARNLEMLRRECRVGGAGA